jgi:Transposase DDE domain group 1
MSSPRSHAQPATTTGLGPIQIPAFRMLASRERRDTSIALTSTLHRFETEVLTEVRNYQGLARLNTDLVQHEAPGTRRVTLDIDNSESPVHGGQEQSAYNGHFESVRYHPLFVFKSEGRPAGRHAPARQCPQCGRVGADPPPDH